MKNRKSVYPLKGKVLTISMTIAEMPPVKHARAKDGAEMFIMSITRVHGTKGALFLYKGPGEDAWCQGCQLINNTI